MKTAKLQRLVAGIVLSMLALANLGMVHAQESEATKTQDASETVRLSKEERAAARAEQKRLNSVWRTAEAVEGFDEVELFQAMEKGEVEVIFRALDISRANITVKNKTERPLAIRMPATFAAIPVLQQGPGGMPGGGGGLGGGGLGGGGLGGGGQGGMGMGGGQGMGGGMGGGMMGGGMGGMGMGGGMGGGMFNIPAGRDGMLKVGTLCLEHGKPDPTPHMNYVMRPLSELNSDPKIDKLCRMLANDQVNQSVAQAAAWNIANELPWNKLMTMNRVELMDGYFERYFSPQQLMTAQRLVQGITQQVAKEAADNERSKSDEQSRYSDESTAGK